MQEEYNLYKKELEENKKDLNQMINNVNKYNEEIDQISNELKITKKKLEIKEKENTELLLSFKEEAIGAKIKLADSNFENDKKYLKLKKQVEKLISALESLGVKVKEISK